MNIRHIISALVVTVLGCVAVTAQAQARVPGTPAQLDEAWAALTGDGDTPLRPVFAAYSVEAGSAHLADTYLTPLKYTGWHVGLDYNRMQAMRFDPARWTMQLHLSLGLDHTDNPARNATMWSAMLTAEWGMMRRWQPVGALPDLTLALGGSTGVQLGCLYNDRNGNNPASAKGAWTLNLTGFAAYPLRIGRLPVTLMYQPVLPVAGIFFAPDYGELYYEIYLGNRSGLVHGAWWGNYFRLDNLLSADLHLSGSTTLRVGYKCNIFSSKVNHTVTHIYNHAFVIGVCGEWLSFNPRKVKRL